MQENWMANIVERSKTDPEYQHWLEKAKDAEEPFERLRSSLSAQEQKILEDYLCACEEMDHTLMRLAWKAGRKEP